MKIYFKQTSDDYGKTKCFDEFYFIDIEFEDCFLWWNITVKVVFVKEKNLNSDGSIRIF